MAITDRCTENYTRGHRAGFLACDCDPGGLAVYAGISSNTHRSHLLRGWSCVDASCMDLTILRLQ
jgi:hypothetical protein